MVKQNKYERNTSKKIYESFKKHKTTDVGRFGGECPLLNRNPARRRKTSSIREGRARRLPICERTQI